MQRKGKENNSNISRIRDEDIEISTNRSILLEFVSAILFLLVILSVHALFHQASRSTKVELRNILLNLSHGV
jgi:hypothetical protein